MVDVWNIKLGRLVLGKTLDSGHMTTLFSHDLISPDSKELCCWFELRPFRAPKASEMSDKHFGSAELKMCICRITATRSKGYRRHHLITLWTQASVLTQLNTGWSCYHFGLFSSFLSLAGITDGPILFWGTLFKRNYLLLVVSLSTRVGWSTGGTTVCVNNMQDRKRRGSLLVCCAVFYAFGLK